MGSRTFRVRADRLQRRKLARSSTTVALIPCYVAAEHARDVGLELHASYRVAGFHYPPPLDHFTHGDSVYKRRPEWRGVDREDRRTPRFAYSYPEVRAYVISLLREVVQYPVDGVCMLYNRRLPLVEYEPQLVEGFRAEHGVDPRSLEPLDPTWLRYRSGVLTEFHRELRAAMDEESRRQGRRPSPSDIGRGRWQRGRKPAFRSRSRSLG